MTTKYLYIDDQEKDGRDTFASAVMDEPLHIDTIAPMDFDALMRHLSDKLADYGGLILDWRLDEIAIGDTAVQYRAGALAQEIRTRGAESTLKELPIVVWSTMEKLGNSYRSDLSSHDLFDMVYYKETFAEKGSNIRGELISLANGYTMVLGLMERGIQSVLATDETTFHLVDTRFTSRFGDEEMTSVHDWASFLFKEAIIASGVLISEDLLAVRLGVDMSVSPDWKTLKTHLPPASVYNGPFHEAWPRWWSWLVEHEWWPFLAGKDQQLPPLSQLTAKQRVDFLKEYLGLAEIVPLEPIAKGYSARFYVMCEVDGRPLDPVDGMLLSGRNGTETLPWQDQRYISRDAALSRQYEDARHRSKRLRLHPAEVERVKAMRRAAEDNGEH